MSWNRCPLKTDTETKGSQNEPKSGPEADIKWLHTQIVRKTLFSERIEQNIVLEKDSGLTFSPDLVSQSFLGGGWGWNSD